MNRLLQCCLVFLFLWGAGEAKAAELPALDPLKFSDWESVQDASLKDVSLKFEKFDDPCPAPGKKEGDDPWGWTKTEIGLQILANVLHLLDWRQTLEIVNHPDRWSEQNILLGDHPSRKEVNLYFGGTAILLNAASMLLPKPERYFIQGLWIGTEGRCLYGGIKLGLWF